MIHRLISLLFLLFVSTIAVANTQEKVNKYVINGMSLYLPVSWKHWVDNPEHGHHIYRDTADELELVIAVHDANIMKFYSDTLSSYQLALSAYENDVDHWVDDVEPKQALENINADYIIRGSQHPEEREMILYGAKNGKIIGLYLTKTNEGNIDADLASIILFKIFYGSK